MVTTRKLAQLAAAATLSVLLGAATVPQMANAAKDGQQAYAASKKSAKAKTSKAKASKSRKHVTNKKVVRKKTVVHRNVRTPSRSRVVVRTTAAVPLVVLGPRVTYRAYGAGWCRALHRGRHWAPRIGWHSGRHVGRVRC